MLTVLPAAVWLGGFLFQSTAVGSLALRYGSLALLEAYGVAVALQWLRDEDHNLVGITAMGMAAVLLAGALPALESVGATTSTIVTSEFALCGALSERGALLVITRGDSPSPRPSERTAPCRLFPCDPDLTGLQARTRAQRAPRGHQVASPGTWHVVETERMPQLVGQNPRCPPA